MMDASKNAIDKGEYTVCGPTFLKPTYRFQWCRAVLPWSLVAEGRIGSRDSTTKQQLLPMPPLHPTTGFCHITLAPPPPMSHYFSRNCPLQVFLSSLNRAYLIAQT
ncbi:hypothetical protein K435DRAFT_972674 [Dendrothele bispora CBS 962.96]|uniref:Uncharacterized protein n=1 Tax=Dendrothele bispora (strain CBS 962.96) TaxID=1314807 RepID=A0A4S8KXB6_DENBC|nr:hypothetical protein K435DRAFT_972674 [Dendrothele bispora CBS 962.96]